MPMWFMIRSMNIARPISASADPAPSDPAPDRAGPRVRDWAAEAEELAAESVDMLRTMARFTMALAEAAQRQGIERLQQEHEDGIERADATLAVARATRSARLSLMLADKIIQERLKGATEAATAQAEKSAAAAKAGTDRLRQRTMAAID